MRSVESASPKRSLERLRAHFEVEKALADELKRATRVERRQVYARMYDELFAAVPDHPRLVRRDDPEVTQRKVERQLRLLRPWIDSRSSFLEFGAGDCRLAFTVCDRAKRVVAVDVADQRGEAAPQPANFELIVYDGYRLDVADASVDIVFSNDLIEHLHPDDVALHFETVRRILRPRGRYLFTTPHRFTGPHDISGYFSDEPQGFHLKEWTFAEIDSALHACGYARRTFYRYARGVPLRQPRAALLALEAWIGGRPRALRRRLGRMFVPAIVVGAAP